MIHEDRMCKMIIKDGFHHVADPEGNILPKQINTFVQQDVDLSRKGWAKVRVTLYVKLEENDTAKNN